MYLGMSGAEAVELLSLRFSVYTGLGSSSLGRWLALVCAMKFCSIGKISGLTLLPLLLLLSPLATQAQQPFTTDDADVTPRGKLHFEFFNSFDLLRPSAFPVRQQNAASFELAYGLLDRVEVGVEAPLLTLFNTRGTGARRVNGIGDTNLAVKYNFYREPKESLLPAFTVSGQIEIPTGDAERALGSGIFDYSLNGIAQKTLTERLTARLNAGAIILGNTVTGAEGIRGRITVLTGGVSLVRRFNSRLYLGVEAAGARAGKPDLNQIQLQLGGNYFLRDNFSIDFGVLTGLRTPDPRLGFQVGFAVDF